MQSTYKPVGGVESVALHPANAVVTALFSKGYCEVTLAEDALCVELLDDGSIYEEHLHTSHGIAKVVHRLRLAADRMEAAAWLEQEFVERAASEGVVAVVRLCDGRQLLVGYSAEFGPEQPLRLEEIVCSSGNTLRENPTVTLHLTSCDTSFSHEII